MDMGKSCVRFMKLDDLPLDVIGRAIKACTMEQYIAAYDALMSLRKNKRAAAMTLDQRALTVARARRPGRPTTRDWFCRAGQAAAALGPLLEIGLYCGAAGRLPAPPPARPAPCSSPSITTTARRRNQAGGSTTLRSSTRALGAWTPCLSAPHAGGRRARGRRHRGRGRLPTVARHWAIRVGLLFIDGGHAEDVMDVDYEAVVAVRAAGRTARDPRRVRGSAHGGQAPRC